MSKMLKKEALYWHGFCSHNYNALSGSAQAACFYCKTIWDPKEHKIRDWIDLDWDGNEIEEATAICPFCGIDSVLPSLTAGLVTPEFLKALSAYWFGTSSSIEQEEPEE